MGENEPRADYTPLCIVAESKKRMRKRSHNSVRSELQNGDRVPEIVKEKMIKFFESGKYSLSEIARYCGVCRRTVERYLEKDEELAERYRTLWQERIDRVEQSMVDLAVNAPNESGAAVIAGEKAGEFLLRYNRREQYSDGVITSDALKNLPRLIIPIKIPPRDQIPENPAQEIIDV